MERLREIEAELSGIAPFLGRNGITAQPYRVPPGYFEHFAENLLLKIRNEEESPEAELLAISPLLASLDRRTPYRVPDHYFSEFRAGMEGQEAGNTAPVEEVNSGSIPEIPVLKTIPLRSFNPFLRYAAAALITGAIATGAFFALHKSSPDPLIALTSVSDQEMANYLENHDVHWVPGTSPGTPTASVDFDDVEISELLSNVSDAELEQYVPDLPIQKGTIN
jgi:hypothetical protein